MTMPDALRMDLLCTGSPEPGLAALFAALKEGGLPRPKPAWQAGMGAEGSVEFGAAALLDWYEGDAEEPRISANLILFLKRLDRSRAMAAALAASRALAPHVDWLLLSRMNSDGPTCLPDAPLLRYHGHLLIATPDLIQSRYEADPIHWPAGVSVEEIEGRILVSRGLEAVDDLDFLRLALPQNWALARQARAGATRYYGPPTEAEREIYAAAPAALHSVGYDPLGQRLEYSCFLEPNDHLAGWEVDALRWRVEKGALDTGEPVKEIQVVFATRDMAEREKRPLLDAGVKVLYMDGFAEREMVQ